MNVTDHELVIVRGINHDWMNENFTQFWIGFSGNAQAVPKDDAFYVGLYITAPTSMITHIGIVESIDRYEDNNAILHADFYLKALIKLRAPIDPGHAIRKHENWKLSNFGLTLAQMDEIKNSIIAL